MLTFEQKLAVISAFTVLQRKDVSLGRVNFHYEASIADKKIVVYHLHPNGNGFVYAERIAHASTDDKGFVNIRDFSEDELRAIIQSSITSLSEKDAKQPIVVYNESEGESWTDAEDQELILVEEDELWNVYTGPNLEMAFETYQEAVAYLKEEGFRRG